MPSICLGSREGKVSRWCRGGARTQTSSCSSSGVSCRERDSEGTQTSACSARLGMVIVTERWGGMRYAEKEPRTQTSSCSSSGVSCRERDSEGTQRSAYSARLGMVAVMERWRQKRNPDECSAFVWVHGKGRGTRKCRGGVEKEPGPR